MNIALFTETYLPDINGVVTHVKSLRDGLVAAGHNVLVVTSDKNTRHHYINEGVLCCPAKEIKRFYGYGVAWPKSKTRLKMLEKFNPDIIHIHNEFGIGFSALGIAKKLKVPVVYTLHTMYDDYLYYVAPKPLIPVMKRISHRYLKYLTKRTNAITGPSLKVQEYLNDCGIAREVNVVPNPVDLDTFKLENVDAGKIEENKRKYGIKDDELVVCFCGRLGKEKSVDILLDYFAKEVKREDKIKLMIIGEGPARKDLMEQAKQLNIDDLVIFTGKVMHYDLVNIYPCAQLYVTTSLSDTNSISMLEAMALGLPVIHRLDELNAGQVVSGVNGYIFTNSKEMYKYMLEYKNMPEEDKLAFKYSVIESVKKSGQDTLAKYLLEIYERLEADKGDGKKRKTHILEVRQ